MREIKFRAWDSIDKKMSEIVTLQDLIGDMPEQLFGRHPWSHVIWLEYTGLKDSHAVEEYFEDIIEEDDGTRRVIEDGCSAVLFKNPKVKYDIKYFWELKSHKVIGNVYEDML